MECYKDHSWHIMIDSFDGKYKTDMYHSPKGYPLWYGRDEPPYLTQHSITYGYNWAGNVKGTIWLEGKEIKVEGFGIRERYVAVDSCATEISGWKTRDGFLLMKCILLCMICD